MLEVEKNQIYLGYNYNKCLLIFKYTLTISINIMESYNNIILF